MAGQLDLLRLQTLPNFHIEFNSLYDTVTEQSHVAQC